MKEAPGLTLTQLPPALSMPAIYGMAVMSDNPDAARLGLFILSEQGQAVLTKYGMRPIVEP